MAARTLDQVNIRTANVPATVAFECDDRPAMIARLEMAGVAVVRTDCPSARLIQLLVEAWNGILLELNFTRDFT